MTQRFMNESINPATLRLSLQAMIGPTESRNEGGREE